MIIKTSYPVKKLPESYINVSNNLNVKINHPKNLRKLLKLIVIDHDRIFTEYVAPET